MADIYLEMLARVAIHMSKQPGRAEHIIAAWEADWFAHCIKTRAAHG